jgi:methionyl-tRNA synthetase
VRHPERLTIVVAATPTPNGDLHVGHMAGPYLAGDVYSRYLAACGRKVIYTTCTDDSQTYVVTTARQRGMPPDRLRAISTAAIAETIAAMGLSMEGLPPVDDRYRAAVADFFTSLHAAGRLALRTVRLPYAEKSGTYLYDALVTGNCPVCLAASSGGVCEECGHPNNFDELLDPRSTLDPSDPVIYREQTILVLPMEEYRDRLIAHFAERGKCLRPRSLQLIGDLLAHPLPDAPVTFPGTWGIPAPFPQTPGQVFYPWAEAMPAVIYSTWWSAARRGEPADAVDEHWRAEHDAEVVYFHGFDNVYHWGLMDLVMLMAHGDRYIRPAGNICNEFYDLHGEKFSTSRHHLIWSVDLLADVPRDLVRWYLSLTGPESQRTNFSTDELRGVTSARLVRPWNRLADALASAVADASPGADADGARATSAAGRDQAEQIRAQFRLCYELPAFSPSRAAAKIADLTDLTGRLAARTGTAARTSPGDLLLAVRALVSCAAPILMDVAAQAAAGGVDVSMSADQPTAIPPFRLPRLPTVPPPAVPAAASTAAASTAAASTAAASTAAGHLDRRTP